MVTSDLLETVFALPVADRVDLLQKLADNLRENRELPESHRAVLQARLADYDLDPSAGSSWDDVQGRITAKLGLA